jgi:hypothetical protein
MICDTCNHYEINNNGYGAMSCNPAMFMKLKGITEFKPDPNCSYHLSISDKITNVKKECSKEIKQLKERLKSLQNSRG